MIATGTDVKPLECVFFMRAVQSRTFFEQMKGRGVRVMNNESFQAVTPDAKAKTHFVIVDAIGVTETELNDTQPLDKDPTVGLDKLMKQLSLGDRTPELVSTIAGRLARLARVITKDDREELKEAAGGLDLNDLVKGIVDALDPDFQFETAKAQTGMAEPSEAAIAKVAVELIDAAVLPLASNPDFRNKLMEVRKSYEQVIDEASKAAVVFAGPTIDSAAPIRVIRSPRWCRRSSGRSPFALSVRSGRCCLAAGTTRQFRARDAGALGRAYGERGASARSIRAPITTMVEVASTNRRQASTTPGSARASIRTPAGSGTA